MMYRKQSKLSRNNKLMKEKLKLPHDWLERTRKEVEEMQGRRGLCSS